MSVTINLTESEKRGLIYLCDKALCGLEKWAADAHYDIDSDAEYKALCDKLTDLDMGIDWDNPAAPVKLDDILAISAGIRLWEKSKVYHCWDVVSERTGEIFTLFGHGGQSFTEAMEYNGLSCEVWKKVSRRW